MTDGVTSIYKGRQPKRPHYVREWAEQRGMRAVDLALELDVDKSVVSRWFSGSTPSEDS
jgi:ribosome-binding protein aMBF1 (putative translation factor)